MANVDLISVHAQIAGTLEINDHTSINKRIADAKSDEVSKNLTQFLGTSRKLIPQSLPLKLTDYIEVVDWWIRAISSLIISMQLLALHPVRHERL